MISCKWFDTNQSFYILDLWHIIMDPVHSFIIASFSATWYKLWIWYSLEFPPILMGLYANWIEEAGCRNCKLVGCSRTSTWKMEGKRTPLPTFSISRPPSQPNLPSLHLSSEWTLLFCPMNSQNNNIICLTTARASSNLLTHWDFSTAPFIGQVL